MASASTIASQLTATNNEFNKAVSEKKGGDLDKEAFLLLLVTQFKYQDPLNPMEDKEYIAQLSQFSSLEQLMNLNTSMGSLTAATQNQQMINATSYIGKDVAAYGTSISKEGEKVSTYRWAIGDTMASGSIEIYDQNNNIVSSYTLGTRSAGSYDFTWDGTDYTGAAAPDGVYNIYLSCKDAKGNVMTTDSLIDGTVQGVVTEDGTTYLRLSDGRVVDLANVRQVATPTSSSSDSSSSDSSSSSSTDNGTSTS